MNQEGRSKNLKRKLLLRDYIGVISCLVGRQVRESELSDVDFALEFRKKAERFSIMPTTSLEVGKAAIVSAKFLEFLRRLSEANSSPLYLWTRHTVDCGMLQVDSLEMVRFSDALTCLPDGILVVVTKDASDRLLFDVLTDEENRVTVEVQGDNWYGMTIDV